ncbi:VOC family protein [Agrobacterium larrymoorei]|uniref:Glyoxalase-like domain-containing protein n=1 Tax=Agrobacterium larrymoorei TaxID=160699 RepID=A0ABU0UMF8_9HYPH|nr:VOC family protein [Agrobacterium larrymoorei]MDQ1186147.1 hypothetical protein [Agrobacterium larrymoorei]
MLKLDHLAIIAPSLEAGADYVRATLGVDMPQGGKHPQMGTHNRLLRLGTDVFLEVIAVDPEAEPPKRRRWFGLDDSVAVQAAWDEGWRLGGWVTRTSDFAGVLARHGDLLGRQETVSRGDREWLFAVADDGSLPCGGVAPSVMDWGVRGNPAPSMPDLGFQLKNFHIQHPEAAMVGKLYADLEIIDPPTVIEGEHFRYYAEIDTPNGVKLIG